jgi:hypothetical protein
MGVVAGSASTAHRRVGNAVLRMFGFPPGGAATSQHHRHRSVLLILSQHQAQGSDLRSVYPALDFKHEERYKLTVWEKNTTSVLQLSRCITPIRSWNV